MGCGESKQKGGSSKLQVKDDTPKKSELKEFEIKICLLGDVNVGKTSIASRFCKNSFNENYINTIGGAYQQQNIVLNNGDFEKIDALTIEENDVKKRINDFKRKEKSSERIKIYPNDISKTI
jgi:GTPase SAR1 family protein